MEQDYSEQFHLLTDKNVLTNRVAELFFEKMKYIEGLKQAHQHGESPTSGKEFEDCMKNLQAFRQSILATSPNMLDELLVSFVASIVQFTSENNQNIIDFVSRLHDSTQLELFRSGLWDLK